MSKDRPLDKGSDLEQAVWAIEEVILKTSPHLVESSFQIQTRKIIKVSGVRHEIDVYVSASLATGYDCVFIFECKNRSKKADKNDIIVFSKKIEDIGAQHGYFVAKAYTSDAKAQAATDRRLDLLLAEELDPTALEVPNAFHAIDTTEINAHLLVNLKSDTAKRSQEPFCLKVETLLLDGEVLEPGPYFEAWIRQAASDRTNHFPSANADEGQYTLDFHDKRTYDEGQMLINGQLVRSLELSGTLVVNVHRGTVISAYEVATRGRYIKVQTRGILEITAGFVLLAPP